MQDIIIQTAQPEQVTSLSRCVKSDVVSDVFTGTILDKGQNKQAFFKAYAFNSENQTVAKGDRGLLNEVVGYLICHMLQVPQPSTAYIALVPRHRIEPLLSTTSQRFQSSLGDMPIMPMFATEQVAPKSIPIYGHHSQQALLAMFAKWEHYKSAAIADEIMVNTDRFPQNILTFGKSFWLIDNGKLIIEQGTNWQARHLNPNQNYTNFIADLNRPDIQADNRKGDSLIQKAYTLTADIKTILPECEFWIDLFSHNDDKPDWKKFLQFIEERYDNIAQLLIQRYGMLL